MKRTVVGTALRLSLACSHHLQPLHSWEMQLGLLHMVMPGAPTATACLKHVKHALEEDSLHTY